VRKSSSTNGNVLAKGFVFIILFALALKLAAVVGSVVALVAVLSLLQRK